MDDCVILRVLWILYQNLFSRQLQALYFETGDLFMVRFFVDLGHHMRHAETVLAYRALRGKSLPAYSRNQRKSQGIIGKWLQNPQVSSIIPNVLGNLVICLTADDILTR